MNTVQWIIGHLTPEMPKLYSNHAGIEAKREEMKLLSNFLNLAGEPVEAEQLFNCSQDPEVTALLKNIRASISNELKQRLEYLATAGIKAVVGLRHKLTE